MTTPPKKDAARKPRTAEETMRAIERQAAADDMERVLAMSPAEVDADLRSHGLDPEAIGAEGAAFAAKLLARRTEQAWQAEAQEKLERVREALAVKAAMPREKLTRKELEKRIMLLRTDPRLPQPVAVMFRNKRAEEASDEELEEILIELESLAEHVGEGEPEKKS